MNTRRRTLPFEYLKMKGYRYRIRNRSRNLSITHKSYPDSGTCSRSAVIATRGVAPGFGSPRAACEHGNQNQATGPRVKALKLTPLRERLPKHSMASWIRRVLFEERSLYANKWQRKRISNVVLRRQKRFLNEF